MTLEEEVYHAMGQVSMCWDPIPIGVFDDTLAKEIAERLIKTILEKSNSNA